MQGPDTRRDGEKAQPVGRKPGAFWGSVVLLLVFLLTPLLLLEIGYRLIVGLPVFEVANWRTDQVIMVNLDELKAVHDPELGWTNSPSSVREGGYTTIEHGVRMTHLIDELTPADGDDDVPE